MTKLSLLDRIALLKGDTLDQASKNLVSRGTRKVEDTTLRHPSQDCGLHLREDGAAELYSGDARLVLMDGTIYLKGSVVIVESEEMALLVSTNRVSINRALINPDLLIKSTSNDPEGKVACYPQLVTATEAVLNIFNDGPKQTGLLEKAEKLING
jgi:hypothetical protein